MVAVVAVDDVVVGAAGGVSVAAPVAVAAAASAVASPAAEILGVVSFLPRLLALPVSPGWLALLRPLDSV